MGAGGNHYVFVSRLPHGPFVELSHLPWPVFQRLIIILIASGVLCYFLSRYFTASISKLQSATKKLAKGDLTVRAGSKAGKRRDEIADLARQCAGHKAESALNRIECEAERLNELIGQLLMLTLKNYERRILKMATLHNTSARTMLTNTAALPTGFYCPFVVIKGVIKKGGDQTEKVVHGQFVIILILRDIRP